MTPPPSLQAQQGIGPQNSETIKLEELLGASHADPRIQKGQAWFKKIAAEAGKEFDKKLPDLKRAYESSLKGFLKPMDWKNLRGAYIKLRVMEELSHSQAAGSPTSPSEFIEGTGQDIAPPGGFTTYLINDDVPLHKIQQAEPQATKDSGPAKEHVRIVDEANGGHRDVNYLVFGLDIEWDTRNGKYNPNNGHYRALKFARYQGINTSQFDFNEISVDIRQFFQLWTPMHVFAVRNAWQFQQGNPVVPLLTVLDWKNDLRGFERGRFRDKAYVLFNFEYRFPIWDFLQGTVFVDTGKVFNGITNFNFNNWRYSVGGGINLFFRDIALFRFQAGYGGEGAQLILTIGPAI